MQFKVRLDVNNCTSIKTVSNNTFKGKQAVLKTNNKVRESSSFQEDQFIFPENGRKASKQ